MHQLALALALLLCLASAHAQQTALLGAWQCQTPQGPASLAFGSGGDLNFNGDVTQYAVHMVMAVQVGAPIRVRWANGEDDQATVHHIVNGRITEIRYGKQVMGRGLCG